MTHLDAAILQAEGLLANLRAQREHQARNVNALIDVKVTLAEYGTGRDSLLAAERRGEIKLARGSRGRILIDRGELEQWLKTRPVKPRRTKPQLRVVGDVSLDAWEAEQAEQLRALGGSR